MEQERIGNILPPGTLADGQNTDTGIVNEGWRLAATGGHQWQSLHLETSTSLVVTSCHFLSGWPPVFLF
jgi:hypothetical protein